MGFFSNLLGLSERPKSVVFDNPVLARICEELGPELAEEMEDAETLFSSVDLALQYFDAQVRAIPGPIEMSAAAREQDSLLQVLFPQADDVLHGFGRSINLRDSRERISFGGHMYPRTFAVLALRHRTREQGADAVPTFVDHTLTALSITEEDARHQIRDWALDRVLKNYNTHLDRLRQNQRLFSREWNIGNLPNSEIEDGSEVVYAEQELVPSRILQGLSAWLRRPAEHLRIDVAGGVIAHGQSNGHDAPYLKLPLLHCADRRQWLVCMVSLPTQEAFDALAQETHVHRYVFI